MVDLNIIKQKIDNCDFDRIKYVYPNISFDTLGEYVSGFNNSNGGYILYGVKDDGDTLEIKGFSANIKEIEDFLKSIFPTNKNIISQKFNYKGKNLFLIEINKGKIMIPYEEKLYTMVKNEKNRFITEIIINQRVFLSYCHKDRKIMKVIKLSLEQEPYIELTVDEGKLDYKSDIVQFMSKIKIHDFAVVIISDSYLRSRNCMYEITELMKDDNYMDKLLFIILSDDERCFYEEKDIQIKPNIYDPMERFKYIEYWSGKEKELNECLHSIKDISKVPMLADDLNKISLIARNVDKILNKLASQKGVSFNEMYESDFKNIKEIILKQIFKSNL